MTETVEQRRYAALAGLGSGALAVGVGMLVARIVDVISPIDAVGAAFIDHTPAWLKDLAIEWFGTNDKRALRVGIFVVLALAAAAAGWLAVRRRWIGAVLIALFGLIGAVIGPARPAQGWAAAVPPVIGAVLGIAVLAWLLDQLRPRVEMPAQSRVPLGWDRRRFLIASGAAATTAIVAGATATALERKRVSTIERSIPVELPPVSRRVTVPAGADVVPGTPYVTPAGDFYRIDTALSFPSVNLERWAMTIGGMVERPLRLTYADLLARPQVEHAVTLACVSNEVGGDLIGNAIWQGVLLADLLAEAGVQRGAEQVFCTSLDDWTCGFPVPVALDGRDALVAIGMNGTALPLAHGFPARLVIPGLYGYVSAVKWLRSIELTTWDRATGYWVPRGWSREAPIKTQSRIDVLRQDGAGVLVAGVAWAQHRGIATVEISADNGEWQEATLADTIGDDTWVQWSLHLQLPPGTHQVAVRATDRTGAVQIETPSSPDPDGATGYHRRAFQVD